MMRKIGFMNYKGGTGKTTTVVNLGHGLALKGKKVLIIDTDPQGSSGFHLGVTPPYTLYDLLMGKQTLQKCIFQARKNLDIICSNEYLFPAEIALGKRRDREKVFANLLKTVTGYDYVLLDCAPSINILNQNALIFANEVFLPVSMEYLSLVGIKQLLNNVAIINKIFKHHLKISKVIPTFFDKRNNKSKDVMQSLQRVFPNCIGSPIRISVGLSEAAGFQQTIFEFDKDSKGAKDFYKLTEEVLNNG